MNNDGFLGIVQQGQFEPLAKEHPNVSRSLRLTTISQQAAQSPESGEASLIPYEGSAILVRGVDSGDWIYSDVIIEKASEILTPSCDTYSTFRNAQTSTSSPLA